MGFEGNPWKLYDLLLDGIPEGIAVTDFCLGYNWTYVEAECGMGLAHTVRGGAKTRFRDDPCSLELKELAQLVKSWSFVDASLGAAALNAWYTRPDRLRDLGVFSNSEQEEQTDEDRDASNPFHGLLDRMAGKKVTVVGHFPNVAALAGACELTVLERDCNSRLDTPDPAAEYVVPSQDYLLVTGTTLINKTAPRLLELGRSAYTVMTGPTTPAADLLFEFGVDVLAGSAVVDPDPAKAAIKGGSKEQWRAGIAKFSWERSD